MNKTFTRDILNRYHLFPKKRRGQNFLVDPHAVEKIIEVSDIKPDDIIVEIGPGLGVLTFPLAERASKVITIEADKDLSAFLEEYIIKEHPGYRDKIEIINDNALTFHYSRLQRRFKDRLKLVANLPYNISTPIIFKLLDEREAFSYLTIMLQQEVARRITASPCIKEYGMLSVMVQFLADVSIEFTLPPSSFYPMPKVYSSVVKFKLLKNPRFKIDNLDLFRNVVKVAFGKRRKTLKNALRDIANLRLSLRAIVDSLERAKIDPIRRGETLSLEEIKALYEAIASSR